MTKTTTFAATSAIALTAPVLFAKAPLQAPSNQDLLGLVEETSSLAIHFSDLKQFDQNWEKSPLKNFWESEQIQQQVTKQKAEMFSSTNDPEKAKKASQLFEKLIALLDEEALLELSVPKLSKELFEAIDDGNHEGLKDFGIHGYFELGDKKDEFLKIADELLEAGLSDHQKVSTQKVEGISFKIVESTKEKEEGDEFFPQISLGAHEKIGIISIGEDLSKLVTQLKTGAKDTITDAEFRLNRPSDIEFLGNFTNLLEDAKEMLTALAAEEESMQQMAVNVEGAWTKLGFDNLGGFSYAIDMSKPTHEIHSKFEFTSEGLLGAFIPNKEAAQISSVAAKDLLSASMSSYDINTIYDRLLESIQTVSPMASMMILGQLGQMETGLGIKLKDDLIAHLDGEIQVLSYQPAEGAQGEKSAYILKVKDANKVSSTLTTINGASGQEPKKETFLEVEITELGLGAQLGAEGPIGYAFIGDQLILGGVSNGAIKEVIKQIKNPQTTIWETEQVKSYLNTLPDNYINLEFANLEKMITTVVKQMTSTGLKDGEFDVSDLEIPFENIIGASYQKGDFMLSQGAFLPKNK